MQEPTQDDLASAKSPQVELTDANMTVFNDNAGQITITVDNNTRMGKTFPSPCVIPAGESAAHFVSASWVPGKSSFDFHYVNGDKMTVDIGTGAYSTSATPDVFTNGKSAAVLAPGKPFTLDVDYTFWFFNGPGVMPPLLNSLIQANMPALIDYINKNPITIPVYDKVSIHITNINADPQTLQCVYAATLPHKNSNDWIINTIFKIGKAEIKGSETINGQEGSLNLSITDAKMWIQFQIDPTFQTKPRVLQFQMSLSDYSLQGTIIDVLSLFMPLFKQLFDIGATPYRMAGLLNNQLNQTIINGINSVLSKFSPEITTLKPDETTTSLAHWLQVASYLFAMPRPSTSLVSKSPQIDLSDWMSNDRIQAMTIHQLKLPGTHDSATSNLSPTLSQVIYPDIEFLWAFSPGTAPLNGRNPFNPKPTPSSPNYLGQTMYDWVMAVGVNSIARAQDLTILQQLQVGIRSFDFRVYFDTRDNNFYIQHALRGPKFEEILTDIRNYIDAHPNSGELIFATVSHTNFAGHPDRITGFVNLIKSKIATGNIFHRPVPKGGTEFDFQTIANETVGSITNGSPKIMFINADKPGVMFDEILTNTSGYGGGPWDKTTPHEPLWQVWLSLLPDAPSIAQCVLTNLTGTPAFVLKDIASKENAQLPDLFRKNGTDFNVLNVDWLEYGPPVSVPELVVKLNNV